MKISLVYPKIPDGKDCPLKKCVAFEKLDGTNMHWRWNNGWKEFGTRKTKFSFGEESKFFLAHPGLEDAVEIFWSSGLAYELNFLFHKKHHDTEIIVFSEFFGPNSFAGSHKKEDIKQNTIFDVMVGGKFSSPEEFIKQYADFGIPKILYKGKYTGRFVEDVRKGKYTSGEGVVCKGVVDGKVYMTKIKTDAYMEKLKKTFHNEWKEYWE